MYITNREKREEDTSEEEGENFEKKFSLSFTALHILPRSNLSAAIDSNIEWRRGRKRVKPPVPTFDRPQRNTDEQRDAVDRHSGSRFAPLLGRGELGDQPSAFLAPASNRCLLSLAGNWTCLRARSTHATGPFSSSLHRRNFVYGKNSSTVTENFEFDSLFRVSL